MANSRHSFSVSADLLLDFLQLHANSPGQALSHHTAPQGAILHPETLGSRMDPLIGSIHLFYGVQPGAEALIPFLSASPRMCKQLLCLVSISQKVLLWRSGRHHLFPSSTPYCYPVQSDSLPASPAWEKIVHLFIQSRY